MQNKQYTELRRKADALYQVCRTKPYNHPSWKTAMDADEKATDFLAGLLKRRPSLDDIDRAKK